MSEINWCIVCFPARFLWHVTAFCFWRTLCTIGSGHACMRGAVFTGCGRGAVHQPYPLYWASASKPAVPAATLLYCCLFWSSGKTTAGLQVPCALWFYSTRVRACELKWWESCWLLFFFEVNYLCGNGCGLCPSKSCLGQHNI